MGSRPLLSNWPGHFPGSPSLLLTRREALLPSHPRGRKWNQAPVWCMGRGGEGGNAGDQEGHSACLPVAKTAARVTPLGTAEGPSLLPSPLPTASTLGYGSRLKAYGLGEPLSLSLSGLELLDHKERPCPLSCLIGSPRTQRRACHTSGGGARRAVVPAGDQQRRGQ